MLDYIPKREQSNNAYQHTKKQNSSRKHHGKYDLKQPFMHNFMCFTFSFTAQWTQKMGNSLDNSVSTNQALYTNP